MVASFEGELNSWRCALARFGVRVFLSLLITVVGFSTFTLGQSSPSKDQMPTLRRQQAREMLHNALEVLKKHYYDPTYHGVDMEARMKQAEERLQAANSLSEAFGIVAWYLEPLKDSHTFFIPPSRPFEIQRGWEAGFVGEKCYITAVQDGSDAAAQGVKPGDEILTMEGFQPTREMFWKMQYAFNALAPRSAMHLQLARPDGQTRQVLVKSKFLELSHRVDWDENTYWDLIRKLVSQEHERRIRWVERGDLTIVKLPSFEFSDQKIDEMLHDVNSHHNLVLDLRGNPGGYENTLTHLTGALFNHEVKIADNIGRKDKKPLAAKSRGDHAFGGKIVVLVDADSASCAEIFARTIQLEKRGVVIGDRSSGSVMTARSYPYQGEMGEFDYDFQVTMADVVMSDGKSLEHTGVTPDEMMLPTAADLAAGRDPVLAHAVESLGGKLTPEEAGKMFPVIWHKPM